MLPSFDELKKLAEQDPERLEEMRKQWVEKTIDEAPEQYQRRLRGLQFQIDMEREKAQNPVSACIRVSKMMHDSLAKLYESITQDTALSVEPASTSNRSNSDTMPKTESFSVGQVIPFPIAMAD